MLCGLGDYSIPEPDPTSPVLGQKSPYSTGLAYTKTLPSSLTLWKFTSSLRRPSMWAHLFVERDSSLQNN